MVSRPRDLTETVPLCSLLPSGNAVALVTHVLIDTTHVRFATVASSDDAVVCSHTHTLMMSYSPSHHKFWNQSILLFVSVSSVIKIRSVSSSAPVTALDLPQRFPTACVFHIRTRNFSKPLSASCFDSLTSFSSRDFSASCTIRSTSD